MDTTVNHSIAGVEGGAVQPDALPPEGHIVGATRALEAVKTSVEQALMGLQFAPQQTDAIIGVLAAAHDASSQAYQSYLDYAFLPPGEEQNGSADETAMDVVDHAPSQEAHAAGQGLGADQASAQEGVHYIPGVHEALIASEQAAHRAGRQVLANSYEHHRLQGVGALEALAANVQLAAATLKWDGENLTAIIHVMGQIDRLAAMAKEAVEARVQLYDLDARAEAIRADRSSAAA